MRPTPSLPQNDSPAQQQQRLATLTQQRQVYAYNFDSRLSPLGIAAQVPRQDNFSFVWLDGIATTALQLLGNVLAIGAKLFDNGEAVQNDANLSETELRRVEALYQDLTEGFSRLSDRTARLHQAPHTPGVAFIAGIIERPRTLLKAAGQVLEETAGVAVVSEIATEAGKDAPAALAQDIFGLIDELLKKLLSEAGELFLQYLGLSGKAGSLDAYSAQFSLLQPPAVASNYETDLIFARMRLAGPNPVLLQGIDVLPEKFPVTDPQFQSVMGPEDTLARAGREGRLYLLDYAVFQGIPTGQTSGGQKYIEAPLALFAVPAAGQPDRKLRAVAIQCAQTPGRANPIFTPKDGTSWRLARLHVQVADGNYHELISHLGLTHLVLEEFTLSTHRQLAPQHPLYLLLTPHFQGTLAINNAAETSLIAPGGPVDRLLAGDIKASTQVSIQAVAHHSINQAFLPRALAARRVEDASKLPDYPYRDDALLLWNDIRAWVNDYLAIYYNDDAAVRGDSELQAWVTELGSPEAGKLKDVGENGGGIQTFEYLVELATYVLFTASVQHAAVNFPQRTVMSYTPALPLAAYAPAPTSVQYLPASTELTHLPPLQMAFLQQAVTFGLGNVYFTRLGGYDTYLREPWFADARVWPALEVFQKRLRATEQEIGRRNLSRIPYETLLPTAIPQSINI
ncbi:MAG TPA: lipoxygenase family protein [Archangium sp.]|uniref:lipoxygenase family protein n=1 Tax=Archangium sp. TaxID=1872627 RepID=UPI002E31F156|nr:lipoxygenase family protein [Archangium sp.]HEX5745109.1 lipoxygenase family protein [Archangium sp.]